MFIDSAEIYVKAGDGGNGMVSFHTARYVPNGGPDGGDGGRGGSIVFVASENMTTLQDFRYKRKYQAENGRDGGRRNQYGKSGADLRICLPVGTLIRDAETGRILADLTENGQEAVIARGGRGGKGNTHFANSVRQAPHFARAGEPGEDFSLQIDLKMLADAALIGLPNVGKSTLLSVASAARPKVADYPFTTVEPMLGVVQVDDFSFVLADIPGLIKGAHMGLGLGISFLKHIERTRLFIHVLDVSGHTGRDPLEDFAQVNQELEAYDPELAQRPQVIALNKTDLADPAFLVSVQQQLASRSLAVFPICAPIREGVPALLRHVASTLRTLPPVALFDKTRESIRYKYEEESLFQIIKADRVYRVTGAWVENLVRSTNFSDNLSLQYFQRLLRKKGVIDALEKAGVEEGDLVVLYDFEFEYLR